MTEIPVCYYVSNSLSEFTIDYFLQHHGTTQGHIKHSQLRGSYLSHTDVIIYRNLFHAQNLQDIWILIIFNSYFCMFIIPLLFYR